MAIQSPLEKKTSAELDPAQAEINPLRAGLRSQSSSRHFRTCRLSAILIAAAAMFASPNALSLEEPAYSVVASQDGLEFRRYESYLVAETVVKGQESRNAAANAGFRRLFNYISGENEAQAEIAMTAPVRQQAISTKISMTAPVRQTPDPQGWTTAFVVPDKFDETNVPRPTDPNVTISKVPAQLVAVLRFSGRWSDANVDQHKAELAEKLAATGINTVGDVVTAFYNSPFSLPFFRRNEVMVQVSEIPGQPSAGTN